MAPRCSDPRRLCWLGMVTRRVMGCGSAVGPRVHEPWGSTGSGPLQLGCGCDC
eukprot:COSAG01_NODE_477_length_16509_cov_38.684217_16_plen_53_part_00